MASERKYTIELTVWLEKDEDPYMDIVDALHDYLPYDNVYTIIAHEEINNEQD